MRRSTAVVTVRDATSGAAELPELVLRLLDVVELGVDARDRVVDAVDERARALDRGPADALPGALDVDDPVAEAEQRLVPLPERQARRQHELVVESARGRGEVVD